MSNTPRFLFIGWLIITLVGIGLIIARTIQFGMFDGNDWVIWVVTALAGIMAYRRK